MEIYFDNAASTKVRDEAVSAMERVMRECYGNPSSTHFMGRGASAELESAREKIAQALGARREEVYFTSGGTEADNWAVLGTAEALARKGRHVITSAIEHDAVLQPMKKLEKSGWEVTYIAPDSAGRIPAEAFAEALREDTVFASIMLVNNETGAVNPMAEYSGEIKRRRLGTVLHTDAVQGFCKIPLSARELGAGLITLSAHKLHGPKGVGALYVRNGIKPAPLIIGGGHESGKRSGTEALPAIAGFGEAAMTGSRELTATAERIRELRGHTILRLAEEVPEAVINGGGAFAQGSPGELGSPFILNLSIPGHRSEVLMSALESDGICVSMGAACKKGSRSRVLEAMRLKKELIDSALRISFSRYSTIEEADALVAALKKASGTLLKAR